MRRLRRIQILSQAFPLIGETHQFEHICILKNYILEQSHRYQAIISNSFIVAKLSILPNYLGKTQLDNIINHSLDIKRSKRAYHIFSRILRDLLLYYLNGENQTVIESIQEKSNNEEELRGLCIPVSMSDCNNFMFLHKKKYFRAPGK